MKIMPHVKSRLGRARPARAALTFTVAAMAMLSAACSGGTPVDTGAGGGSLVVAQSSDILSMDPAMYRSRITQTVVRNVFNALVNQDDKLAPIPELATSWQSVDPTTWRFTLRENVTFHNGEKFDAAAVKFSIDRVINPAQKSPRASMLSMVESVTVENPTTVVIKTKEPAPTLLAGLAVNEIVPPQYVQKVGDKGFAEKPVGTGPFSFGEWIPNERVVLKANPDYWGGKPKVGQLVFRPIPEVSARVAALQAGDVQIAAEIPPDLSKTLSGDTTTAAVSGTRIFFLAMNVKKAPFTDTKVRVAVNQAIDRDTLVSSLYQGFGRPLNQPAFPEMIGYSSSLKPYAFDEAAAKRVLSGTEPVRLDVEEGDKTLAEAVAGQLRSAGLSISVNVLETQAFDDSTATGAGQAYLSSWGVAEGDADVILARHFWSPSREGAVYTGYTNKKLDELIVQGRSTTDTAARTGIYQQAMDIVMRDAPWAPIVNPKEIYGVSVKVHDWTPSPIGRINVVQTSLS